MVATASTKCGVSYLVLLLSGDINQREMIVKMSNRLTGVFFLLVVCVRGHADDKRVL
jgi:hypothetical protein